MTLRQLQPLVFKEQSIAEEGRKTRKKNGISPSLFSNRPKDFYLILHQFLSFLSFIKLPPEIRHKHLLLQTLTKSIFQEHRY